VLARELAEVERHRGNLAAATRFEDQAAVAEKYSALIHKHVLNVPEEPAAKESGTTDPAATEPELPKAGGGAA
jgi:hypothetical protein